MCSKCAAEWLFQRLECPYCGTQDQNTLAYFTDDKGLYRLYICEHCRHYLKAIDLRQTRMHPEHVVALRPDTPWVTFYNQDRGVAFANLYLDLAMTNIEGGEASSEQPFVYIQNGPWYYLARGLVYSFGTNNQTRMLPVRKGSLYSERVAFYPFSFKKEQGYSTQVDALFSALKYPLSIMESIETFSESPDGWVTPILTEPFEEGVEQAIGGKKKK